MDVGVVIPERQKVEAQDLSVGGSHREEHKSKEKT
jgi:hypothetical protein